MISTTAIEQIVDNLKNKRHRDSTRENYYCVWRTFNEFFIQLDRKPDTWEDRIILFVGYLITKKLQSSTIRSYVSAIKGVLHDDGYQVCEDKYLLTSLTRACKYVNDQVRTRLPIQKGLLRLLLKQIDIMYGEKQPYLEKLYKALFSTAYYGLFRVSEFTGTHAVHAKNVHVGVNKNKLMFVLLTSKTHWKNVKPQTIKIDAISNNTHNSENNEQNKWCPYKILRDFIEVRRGFRQIDEPFFIFSDGTPVSSINMREMLKNSLKFAGFDEKLYVTHSFRIGCSKDLLSLKILVETIKKLGRWKSNSVFVYLS